MAPEPGPRRRMQDVAIWLVPILVAALGVGGWLLWPWTSGPSLSVTTF